MLFRQIHFIFNTHKPLCVCVCVKGTGRRKKQLMARGPADPEKCVTNMPLVAVRARRRRRSDEQHTETLRGRLVVASS